MRRREDRRVLGGGESVGSLWSCCRAAGGADAARGKETDQETPAPLGCAQSAAEFCRFAPPQRGRSRDRVHGRGSSPELNKQPKRERERERASGGRSPDRSVIGENEPALAASSLVM
ncbi:hypothetical protein D4764_09G0004470 [Takifugu flavidus]|uniref:Uncharacterized protein n=1 Tax=Takifugu flavidus TaxID=433684 RepID=A0A5C6MLD6_9TELE|nr:hypothetical protein D4764_09G0004470 [Takifugu flavidus]